MPGRSNFNQVIQRELSTNNPSSMPGSIADAQIRAVVDTLRILAERLLAETQLVTFNMSYVVVSRAYQRAYNNERCRLYMPSLSELFIIFCDIYQKHKVNFYDFLSPYDQLRSEFQLPYCICDGNISYITQALTKTGTTLRSLELSNNNISD